MYLMYRWLLVTRTDNGLHFYNIFETRELAVLHLAGDIREDEWHEDASGDLSHINEGGYSYFISEEPYTSENHCGGCKGLGNHRKHCRKNPAYEYRLELADKAESLGDSIGPNNHGAANYCYAAGGLLREQSKQLKEGLNV